MTKRFFKISLVFLSLCFSTEALGFLPHPLYRFLGLFCLALYGLWCFPFGIEIQNRARFSASGMLVVISLLFFHGDIVWRVGGTVLFLIAFERLIKDKDSGTDEFLPLVTAITFYFYFLIFYLHSPPFWLAVKQFSISFSTLVSGISGVPVVLSSTFLGIPVTALFLIFMIVTCFFPGKGKRPGFFILCLFMLVFMNTVYLVLLGKMPELMKPVLKGLADKDHFLNAFFSFLFADDYPLKRFNFLINSPVLLFVLCMPALFLLMVKTDFKAFSMAAGAVKKRYALGFLLSGAAAVSLLLIDAPAGLSQKKDVILYKEGFLNWSRPDFKSFGSRSAGMFGMLPDVLSSMGFSPKMAARISGDMLKNAGILVMINVDRQLPEEDIKAIHDFVEQGGSLLILGEHTFFKHGTKRVIFNDILEPYQIKVNFDSADWFVGGWIYSYQYAAHPITWGMRNDMNNTGIVIGASLNVEPPAFPIVIGKYGYSDPGDLNSDGSRGYLGSLNYEPGEPVGDVILCAAQHCGKGKLLVFGDTSGFVNAIMVKNVDFINRVFTWLSRDESPKKHTPAMAAGLVLMAVAVLCCVPGCPSSLTLIISVLLSLSIVWGANAWKQHDAWGDVFGNIAYIDVSHGERFSPESWNENAAMGLYLNLMRNGYLTYALESFEQGKLNTADLLVFIAPSQPFTREELGWIKDYVFRGGNIILTAGWEEKEASDGLMKQFGLSIDNIPLGRFVSIIPRFNQRVMFAEAWPVVNLEGTYEIIASYENMPVIVKKRHGEGQIVLVGDSSFFWNKNLEMEKSHIQKNVDFLKWLSGTLGSGKGGKP